MTRKCAIEIIMNLVGNEDLVVTSTGMISREVFQVKDRPLNFYMQGSMGNALGIGIGLALHNPSRLVRVISGDGATLMSLGTIALFDSLKLKNLQHFVLDNGCHATTGGQATCSHYAHFGFCFRFYVSDEVGDAPRIPLSPKEITERFKYALRGKR